MKLATYEAIVENGQIKLTDPVLLPEHAKVYVVVAGIEGKVGELEVTEPALLAEPALAEDWSRPEEDAAWSHLQSAE